MQFHITREYKGTCLKINNHPYTHSNIIHKSQDMETSEC